MDTDLYALGAVWYVVFLLSLTCHEAAHALAAKWGGDETAAAAGQVTLNPIPHIQREPFGTVLVPFLTFFLSHWMMGWASAPYDPLWAQRHPKRAGLMALAGPAANFSLASIAAIGMIVGCRSGLMFFSGAMQFSGLVSGRTPMVEGVAVFLSILFSLNLLLGVFNLLPLAPLDGNTAIAIILPERAAERFFEISRNPMFSLVGLVIAWQFFGRLFSPVYEIAIAMLYWATVT